MRTSSGVPLPLAALGLHGEANSNCVCTLKTKKVHEELGCLPIIGIKSTALDLRWFAERAGLSVFEQLISTSLAYTYLTHLTSKVSDTSDTSCSSAWCHQYWPACRKVTGSIALWCETPQLENYHNPDAKWRRYTVIPIRGKPVYCGVLIGKSRKTWGGMRGDGGKGEGESWPDCRYILKAELIRLANELDEK